MGSKVIIAAGGTGGHLFPAQALAQELIDAQCQVIFAGAHLSTNRYFQQKKFTFFDVPSATPFRRSVKAVVSALICLVKGVRCACALLESQAPDLVVGFGSFHSFSILLAARIKKIPYVLFEGNAFPGKVNRLFSKGAQFTAVYFPSAAAYLQGNVVEVHMPARSHPVPISAQEARNYFGLDNELFTFVVFGGSQGAVKLNQAFVKSVESAWNLGHRFQIIHLTGSVQATEEVSKAYAQLDIPACVKDFESQMHMTYRAASLVISRAGAATISELIAYCRPSLLIPYPHAADNHQKKNAEFLTNELKAALCIDEKEVTHEGLSQTLIAFLDPQNTHCVTMQEALAHYQSRQLKEPLCPLICHQLLAQ